MLKKHIRESTGTIEWALMSVSRPNKVLKWFGKSRPSPAQVAKEEARVERHRNLNKGK
uniref:Uncharacterized protein n=1 Tax=viral metagenome TaxID=1070528 RepID=A0A6M3KV06_9ZZZZ